MSKARFVLKRSFQQISRNPSVSGIIIFTLSVCTFAALLLTAAAADSYAGLREIEGLKKLYYFYGTAPGGENEYNASVTDSETDGVYPVLGELFSEDFPDVEGFLSIEAFLPDGKKINAVYSADGSPKAAEMAEGRTYSDEELKEGANVAVANVSECEGVKIGEKINIGGAEFELVGKTYGQTSVPLFAVLREGWPVSFGDVRFSEYLTASQEARLLEILAPYGVTSVKTAFDVLSKSDYDDIKSAILSLCALIFISGIIIAEVFGYSVSCRLREFNIYKTLGAQGIGFFGIFYLPTLIMLALSLAIGGTLFRLSLPARRLLEIADGFTPQVAFLAIFAVVLLMGVVTVPMYIKILRQSPKDGEGLT